MIDPNSLVLFYLPIPQAESSKLLMKLSLISDIKCVKQKNESASACSVRKRRQNNEISQI